MTQIFPEWTNKVPVYIVFIVVFGIVGTVAFVWYYFSPKFTDVGYRPAQPVPYSHKLHAGDLGMDCRYCHSDVEFSPVANIPPTQTCMNCHKIIKLDSEKLEPIRESWRNGKPMEWIRVDKLPDYAYFTHEAHLRAGVGCSSCHGNVADMEVVAQVEPLSMSWCLSCHRNPDMYLRTESEITDMTWMPPANQMEIAAKLKKEKGINPPVDCSGCHR